MGLHAERECPGPMSAARQTFLNPLGGHHRHEMITKEETFQKIIEQHTYVPKHELADEGEIKALLTTLGIKIHNLPKIYKNDPAIKYKKLKKGDVVKITRNSLTAGVSVYYRVVV